MSGPPPNQGDAGDVRRDWKVSPLAPDLLPTGSIGSETWPGTAKLLEETGELQQVLGKLMAYPDSPHPDGSDLQERLIEELGDVAAAIAYFTMANGLHAGEVEDRRREKYARFVNWHRHERGR